VPALVLHTALAAAEAMLPSSVTAVLAAACTLQLLQYAVCTVSSNTISRKTMSHDFLTLRYHGRDPSRFSAVTSYTTEICNSAPATCMDLRLWECAESPLDMRVPYVAEAKLGVLETGRKNNIPSESAAGSRLLLANSGHRDPQLLLWSGCNASCGDCEIGTGKFLIVQHFPQCISTATDGVFGILYNDNSFPEKLETYHNCWPSLDAYDFEAEKQNRRWSIVKYCAIASAAMVGCASAALLLICCRMGWRRRGLHSGTGVAALQLARTIGKAAIEEHFPVSRSHEGNQCVVCLLDLEENERCRKLQCGHEFHAECIVGWWTHVRRTSLECPLCKRRQRLGDEDPEDATEAPAASNNNGAPGRSEAGTAASEAPATASAASGTAADDPERGQNRPDEVVEETPSIARIAL